MAAVRRSDAPAWGKPGTKIVRRPSWIVPPAARERVPASAPPSRVPGSVGSRRPMASAAPAPMPMAEEVFAESMQHAASFEESGVTTMANLEYENTIEALRQQVAELAGALMSVRQRILESIEPDVVRLAYTIAERVVGREVSAEPELVLGWIRESAAALPNRDEIVVAVAPDVAERISEAAVLGAAISASKMVIDPTLAAGTCELREGSSSAPAGAGARLEAVADALGVPR